MLVTGYDIVRRLPDADADRVRKELSGNLCRCTGYAGIVAAIMDVLENNPPAAKVQPQERAASISETSAAQSMGAVSDTSLAVASNISGPASLPTKSSLDSAPTLSRTLQFDVSPSEIWEVISDPEKVTSCIPGGQLDSISSDNLLQGKCAVSMGPIKAAFAGTAKMELDETVKSGHVIGRGKDGLSRSQLDGMLDFKVTELPEGGSELALDMVYKLTGPLSQFSRPALVAEIADRILDQVAASIDSLARGEDPKETQPRNLNGLSLMASVITGWIKRILRFR
jgi:carbon-monoxide dehydrogenase small subunit